MPIETISLTEDQSRFIASQIEAGRFKDAEEVVNAGLHTLEQKELEHQETLIVLRAAIAQGEVGGIVEGGVFARVLGRLDLLEHEQA